MTMTEKTLISEMLQVPDPNVLGPTTSPIMRILRTRTLVHPQPCFSLESGDNNDRVVFSLFLFGKIAASRDTCSVFYVIRYYLPKSDILVHAIAAFSTTWLWRPPPSYVHASLHNDTTLDTCMMPHATCVYPATGCLTSPIDINQLTMYISSCLPIIAWRTLLPGIRQSHVCPSMLFKAHY